jgi:hypothetical protein
MDVTVPGTITLKIPELIGAIYAPESRSKRGQSGQMQGEENDSGDSDGCGDPHLFWVGALAAGQGTSGSRGWYVRAAFLNGCQLAIVVLAGVGWNRWFQGHSVFDLSGLPPVAQGLVGWFIGTFVFYWWHRARHDVDAL